MSAIGEYVHYHAARYSQHGITREDGAGANIGTWNQIRNSLLSRIRTIHGDKKILQMENKFNKIYNALTDVNNKEYENARNAVIDYIMNNSKDKNKLGSDTVFNFATGNVYNLQTAQKEGSQVQSKVKQVKHRSEKSVSYIETITERLKSAQGQLVGIADATKKNIIAQKLDKIEKDLEEIGKYGQEALRELASKGVNINKGLISQTDADEMIKNMNLALGLVDGVGLNNAKGEFLEALAAVVNLAAQGEGFNALSDIENEIKRSGGANKSSIKIESDFVKISKTISDSVDGFNEVFKGKSGHYTLKVTSSQQKMDAEFTYNKQKIPLSIKNYNLSSGHLIHLVSGMPLSSILFSLEDKDITNHFLNIFSVKTSGGIKKYSSGVDISGMKNIAIEALTIWLLYVAATGRGSGKSSGFAEVLLIKDNSKQGGVRMYDIGILVNTVAQNYQMLRTGVDITPDLTSLYFDNKYISGKSQEGNIEERLARLLLSVHQRKITAAIRPSLLKNMRKKV